MLSKESLFTLPCSVIVQSKNNGYSYMLYQALNIPLIYRHLHEQTAEYSFSTFQEIEKQELSYFLEFQIIGRKVMENFRTLIPYNIPNYINKTILNHY